MLRCHARSLFLLSGVVAAIAGCAEQQPAINRVEAYALPKSLLAGEWYYGQTVVDVPGTNTLTMVGNTNYSGLYRVRWDIQEDYLYARKSYELVDGAKNANQDTGEYKGTIVGAWRISSQFDIKRSYNATTGEELNTIEENASDCKWYDCTHMRVDWSQNLAIDYMFLDSNDGLEKAPMPFQEQDAYDARWKPIFDARNGYIDFTTSMVVSPGITNAWGGQYPTCWLFSGQNAECSPEVTKVRNSFWRRDPNRDYEPRVHGAPYDEWFGFFIADRFEWESHYGITNKTKVKLINRHNIWDKHHDAAQPCTSSKDCTTPGSICDTWIKFHKQDVATDTDHDGLPDSFEKGGFVGADEKPVKLSATSADSDGDGIFDSNDDADGNGVRDLEDYWKWNAQNQEFRCTLPMAQRDPWPVVYYDSGNFPRSLRCDEDRLNAAVDKNYSACQQPYVWDEFKCGSNEADPKKFEETCRAKLRDHENARWSTFHRISEDYNRTWWKVFLRGGYGWSHMDYLKWIYNKDIGQFKPEQQEVLRKFGSPEHGFYAFTGCPNNPVQATDPWPCRFNHMKFADAEALMAEGRTFGLTDENGKEIAPAPRHGDIRFSFINYVKDYYDGWALLGLGPSMTDPRTGENLAGVANVYVLNDWAATYAQEMVQLIRGKLSPTDFINGVNLENWIKKVQGNNGANEASTAFTGNEAISPAQLTSMYQSMVQPWMKKIPRIGTPESLLSMPDINGVLPNSRAIKRKLLDRGRASGLFDPALRKSGVEIVAGTPLEKQLIDEEVLMASGINPAAVGQLDDEVLKKASPVRGGFIHLDEAAEKFRWELANRRAFDFLSMSDDAVDALAYRFSEKELDDPQIIWNKAREIIMRAVTTHEMGHTMGLHHNWGGSEDVMNFHNEYWKLRTNNWQDTKSCTSHKTAKDGDGQLCPFFIKPMKDFQRRGDGKSLAGMYEYAYSSVMDYAGRYTIDGNGLGKYDTAALMYGHADKVEVYNKTGNIPMDSSTNMFDEWYASNGSPLVFTGAGPSAYHYTLFYGQMGDNLWDDSNREIVPFTAVKSYCHENGVANAPLVPCDSLPADKRSQPDGDFVAADKPRVPYVFCTYTRGDISDGCNTRDWGSDQYERMKMHVDSWDTWYVLRSFTRYAFGGSPETYVSRNRGRTYGRLKHYNDSYALYQSLFAQWFPEDMIEKFFTDPVSGWGAYTVALHDAFNLAMRTIAMPDVKQFELGTKPDGQRIYAEAEYKVHFRSDITNARFFTTSWNDTDYGRNCGLQWWECLHHYGFYLDKIMALFTLINPYTNFVARDTAEDIRQWRISFFDNFTSQIIDFFGALLAEDYDAIAPWYDTTKPADQTVVDASGVKWQNGMAWRDYATPALDPPKPQSGAAVEAATRFTMQVYAAVYGMLLFQKNFDNEFVERGRMWKKGKGTTWEITPTAEVNGTTEFVDPLNGSTYAGIDYKDGRGIAQRMIAHANKLKARSKYCSQTAGQPDYCEMASANDKLRAETAMIDYKQLMDIMVQVTSMYDIHYGNSWSWDPYDP